jgi:regulator of sigma E protease
LSSAIPILFTIALFAAIIVFHEFGHFVAAKLAGIPVYEFALGFGRPVLLSFKFRQTQYSLRPIPIGGYVRIAGMEPDEDVPNGFDKKPIPARLAVIGAGAAMNFVLAIVVFWVMGLIFGKVIGHTTEVRRVVPHNPAAIAGIRPGDVLVFARSVPLGKPVPAVQPVPAPPQHMKLEALRAVISNRPDMPISLTVRRGDKYLAFHLVPRAEDQQELKESRSGKGRLVTHTVGLIGVVFADITKPQSFFESVSAGFNDVYLTTRTLIVVLFKTVIGQLPAAVGGPIQIGAIMTEAFEIGWRQFLFWSALISINIGVLNLLPVPALDGSRLVFIMVEGIRRRPIDRRKEAIVHLIGFALLVLLLVVVTFKDIMELVAKRF